MKSAYMCGVCGAYSEVLVPKKLLEPCARNAEPLQLRNQRDALMPFRHPAKGRSMLKAGCSWLS